jgi:hypothetical protein
MIYLLTRAEAKPIAYPSKDIAEERRDVLNDEDRRLLDAQMEYAGRAWKTVLIDDEAWFVHEQLPSIISKSLIGAEKMLGQMLQTKHGLSRPMTECQFHNAKIEEVEMVMERPTSYRMEMVESI